MDTSLHAHQYRNRRYADGGSPEGFRTGHQEADGGGGAPLDDQAATSSRRWARRSVSTAGAATSPGAAQGRGNRVPSSSTAASGSTSSMGGMRRMSGGCARSSVRRRSSSGDLMLVRGAAGPRQRAGGARGRGPAAPLRDRANGRRCDRRRGGSQFPLLAQARHHRPQDHRPPDRHLVHSSTGRPLLHNDGDFRPMNRHLGLIEVPM